MEIKLAEQIEKLKRQCKDQEERGDKDLDELAIKNDQIENKIREIKSEKEKYEIIFSTLAKEYDEIISQLKHSNDNSASEKEKELREIRQKNDNLKQQLNQIKYNCDLLKDENCVASMISYWPPTIMFKYIQEYDKQRVENSTNK